jgi:hypothetical protein
MKYIKIDSPYFWLNSAGLPPRKYTDNKENNPSFKK